MFAIGQQVFPKWSQRLPAYTVARVGAIMVTLRDQQGYIEVMHKDDIVAQDPAVVYEEVKYEVI
jgi:hypothetical protein